MSIIYNVLMIMMPFISLGVGILMGLFIKSTRFVQVADKISTIALIFLMITIGTGIGLDESIIRSFLNIGFNCLVICICAITFSVLVMLLFEKTLIPLEKLDKELLAQNIDLNSLKNDDEVHESEGSGEKKKSSLIWIMPGGVLAGLALGILLRGKLSPDIVDTWLTLSLIVLYVCVGVMQGANIEVFVFIKKLGFKILFVPVAVIIGSITGGFISGIVLNIPFQASVISAGGMSFYSITGAYMTDTFGLEIGTYGFIVNVMREFFTILLMPLLIKISSGSPIVSGAAGNMDTMLAPITKFVGIRLGLVTLVTGIILTFIVPVLLPLLNLILGFAHL